VAVRIREGRLPLIILRPPMPTLSQKQPVDRGGLLLRQVRLSGAATPTIACVRRSLVLSAMKIVIRRSEKSPAPAILIVTKTGIPPFEYHETWSRGGGSCIL
jgi:hypothetical protein